MIWLWPQWTMAILLFLTFALQVGMHGQQRPGKYNAGVSLVEIAITVALLYFGGFWGIQP